MLDILHALLLMSMLALAFGVQQVGADLGTMIVPDDYFSIQEAIDHARPGATIYVKAGIYLEHVVVDKNGLRLVGEDRDTTIIDGGGTDIVVYVVANGTVFSGFTVQNSGCKWTDSGIYLDNSFDTSVSSNSVINNNLGIYIYESSNSILRNNNMVGNRYNFGVYGFDFRDYIHNIDVSNIVDGKPIIYWINQTNKQLPTNAGYVAIVNSTNVIVENLTLTKNWQGMLFAYTTNLTIKNVTATNNMDGIWFLDCSDCSVYSSNSSYNSWGGVALVGSYSCFVTGNNINSNGEYGIFLSNSSDNMFYNNDFMNNRRQAWLYGFNVNTWDDGYPSGGNYWSDYGGADEKSGPAQDEAGSDGIGDTTYVIDSHNKDRYPLMKPWGPSPSKALSINIVLYAIAGIGAIIITGGICLKKIGKRPSTAKMKRYHEMRELRKHRMHRSIMWFTILGLLIMLWLVWLSIAVYGWGNWGFVILNIVFFGLFILFTQFKRRIGRLSASVYLAFVIALYAEMYGFPLTMYIIMWLFGYRNVYTLQYLLAEVIGEDLFAFIFHLFILPISIIVMLIGILLIIFGWRKIYRAKNQLVTTGIYGHVRHPQYLGFLLLTLGMNVQWITIPTLMLWPVLVVIYYRLAKEEDEELGKKLGEEYRKYKNKVPMFMPRVRKSEPFISKEQKHR